VLEGRCLPSTVTNLDDAGAGSLRQAIADTKAGGTVDFDEGLAGTILLRTGQLAITKDLTIVGPGADVITVSGNHASRVFNIGATFTVDISGLTIADGGGVAEGGGIFNAGTLTVTSSTLSGNSASDIGGGILNNFGTLTVTNSTLSGNSASLSGGGISTPGRITHSRNTIIAGNTAANGPDVFGNLGSLGHNLIGNTQGGSGFDDTDLLNVNPLLGPLQDNGGPTQTMALLPGSPAIDAGDNTDAPDWDQRGPGFPRIVGIIDPDNPIIDIGAYEVQADLAAPVRIVALFSASRNDGGGLLTKRVNFAVFERPTERPAMPLIGGLVANISPTASDDLFATLQHHSRRSDRLDIWNLDLLAPGLL
jgi:hypothetical protein